MCLRSHRDAARPPRHAPLFDARGPHSGFGGGLEGHPGYAPYVPQPKRVGFHTSVHEILHIITAILLLTGIFGIWLSQQEHGLDWMEQPPSVYVELGLIALVASGTGFLLHELSHKVVAQLYGHWAEFRAYWWGLAIPLVVVALTRIIFAAPGAVMISGYVTRRQNGIISAAGPTMNILIALIAYPFTTQVGSSETFLGKMALYVAILNALLAVFNMIPLGQLDGRKVWRWSPAVYILLVAAAIGALVLVFLSPAAFGLTG